MNRRSLLARSLTMGLFYGIGRQAFAQAGDGASDNGPEVKIDQAIADWFESLKRPFNDGSAQAGVASCCNAGDGYPIDILEEPTYRGTALDGRVRVTDPTARTIVLPDGSRKWRPAIRGGLEFPIAGEWVCPLKDGNPTKTAWAFLYVDARSGQIQHVYCIVPLPPGF